MKIYYEDIELESIKEHHIEMIRNWRNKSAIQNRMIYREHISGEQQQAWFEKLTQENQLFFLCKIKQKPIGLIYANELNWTEKISYNSGIFITDDTIYGSGYPILIALLFTYCGFQLNLKENRVKILNNNHNAIQFNKALGYVLKEQGAEWSTYWLKKEDFRTALKTFPSQFKIKEPLALEWENTAIDDFVQKIVAKSKTDSDQPFKIINESETND